MSHRFVRDRIGFDSCWGRGKLTINLFCTANGHQLYEIDGLSLQSQKCWQNYPNSPCERFRFRRTRNILPHSSIHKASAVPKYRKLCLLIHSSEHKKAPGDKLHEVLLVHASLELVKFFSSINSRFQIVEYFLGGNVILQEYRQKFCCSTISQRRYFMQNEDKTSTFSSSSIFSISSRQ